MWWGAERDVNQTGNCLAAGPKSLRFTSQKLPVEVVAINTRELPTIALSPCCTTGSVCWHGTPHNKHHKEGEARSSSTTYHHGVMLLCWFSCVFLKGNQFIPCCLCFAGPWIQLLTLPFFFFFFPTLNSQSISSGGEDTRGALCGEWDRGKTSMYIFIPRGDQQCSFHLLELPIRGSNNPYISKSCLSGLIPLFGARLGGESLRYISERTLWGQFCFSGMIIEQIPLQIAAPSPIPHVKLLFLAWLEMSHLEDVQAFGDRVTSCV